MGYASDVGLQWARGGHGTKPGNEPGVRDEVNQTKGESPEGKRRPEALMQKAATEPAVIQGSKTLWADLDYIRRRIPVTDVARELGLCVRGLSANCWRTDAHQHGDRSPSLYFTRKNRWRCAVCDSRTMSNLDLVQAVLGCNLRQAVAWFEHRWPIPQVPRGKHTQCRYPQAWRFRIGTSGLPFEDLVMSGFWAMLSKAAQSLLPPLLVFTDPETGWATLSYRGLQRYAGLSCRGVRNAVSDLQRISLLDVEASPGPAAPLRPCNRYRLNFEAPAFLELLAAVHQKHQSEIQLEKESQRQRQRKARRGSYTQGKTLTTRECKGEIQALLGSAGDCPKKDGV